MLLQCVHGMLIELLAFNGRTWIPQPEHKITVDPRPFSDQSTGLTDQTCNHSAICADQFFSRCLLQQI